MAGEPERNVDADEQGLVGDRVEIGAELASPAITFGDIAVGCVGNTCEQEEQEGSRHLMVDDKPYYQRNEHDPHEREAVGDIHLTFLPAADCAPFAPSRPPTPDFSRFDDRGVT